jgi:ribose 5-phosphate isomerase B
MARITIASDHAGYRLKQALITHLEGAGHDVDDLGTNSEDPVDYPPICAAAGRAVVAGRADFAIVLGGSGQGETMAANKVRGVRAALCHDEYTARLARQHNNANVLGLGGRILGEGLAVAIVDEFLSTGFEGGRHERRVAQIGEIEDEEAGS